MYSKLTLRSLRLTEDSVLKPEAVVGDGRLHLLVGAGQLLGRAKGLALQHLLQVVDLLVTQTLGLTETTQESRHIRFG